MSNLSTGASYCFAPQATQKSTHLALVFLFGSPSSLFWFSAFGLHNTILHENYARTVKLSARFCCQVKTSSYFFCRKQVQQARSWCERKNANSDSTIQSKAVNTFGPVFFQESKYLLHERIFFYKYFQNNPKLESANQVQFLSRRTTNGSKEIK